MAEFDSIKQVLNVKLVYYGPALSGKTTNLTKLHDLLEPHTKGAIMTLETQNDRTLFFDLLPIGIRLKSGMIIKIRIYTVPGQVQHDSTRKAILSRSDGVVFVADSQRNQSFNNAESFKNLMENLNVLGINSKLFPLVIQYNKRDLPNIISESEINQRWNGTPWSPVVFASALTGCGLLETLRLLLSETYRLLNEEYQLHEKLNISLEKFIDMASMNGKTNE